jgi:hypothetical protein
MAVYDWTCENACLLSDAENLTQSFDQFIVGKSIPSRLIIIMKH